jgi:hypothetical protein
MNPPATNAWVRGALSRYWPKETAAIEALEIAKAQGYVPSLRDLIEVRLPEWAADCGVNAMILVPGTALSPRTNDAGEIEAWRRVDWWAAAAGYLSGAVERTHEAAHGPIHSYSYRLGATDARVFEHAWVNRIALFLRRWAAQTTGRDETAIFGERPAGRLQLTHDVDALGKTLAIRFKQSAFRGFRALRLSVRGELDRARRVAASAGAFAFGSGTYDRIDDVAKAGEAAGHRGLFFIHARRRLRSPVDALLDPGYSLGTPGFAACTLPTLRGTTDPACSKSGRRSVSWWATRCGRAASTGCASRGPTRGPPRKPPASPSTPPSVSTIAPGSA